MKLKLIVAVIILVTALIAAFAQSAQPDSHPPKLTVEDAQKLIEVISGDKDKLKAYCEIGKLHEQLDKADDMKEFDALAIWKLLIECDEVDRLGVQYINGCTG